jgi:predicted phosphohydrolase
MKIQYASDLHLEFKENKVFLNANPLQVVGDVLLLAGDIVPFKLLEQHKDFFSFLSDSFAATYWVPGNHEYYHFNIATKSGVVNEKIRSNVFLMNNTSVMHDDIKFIFSTLWSNISPTNEWQVERGMGDFHVIKYRGYKLSIKQYNQLHADSLAFLQKELAIESSNKSVVVTHHVPTFMNYPEAHKGDSLNEAFAVELFDLIEATSPDYWIYGHTHGNTPNFEIGKTRLLTNQLGYVKYEEQLGFSGKRNFIL